SILSSLDPSTGLGAVSPRWPFIDRKGFMEYTCPMHPEIIRSKPGNCPICGMALEPKEIRLEEEENQEYLDMCRRFWVSLILTLPLLLSTMTEMVPKWDLRNWIPAERFNLIQLVITSPVVLWGGWPFFVRGWQSIVNRSLNMFTLIAIGTGMAYLYSLVAAIFPDVF